MYIYTYVWIHEKQVNILLYVGICELSYYYYYNLICSMVWYNFTRNLHREEPITKEHMYSNQYKFKFNFEVNLCSKILVMLPMYVYKGSTKSVRIILYKYSSLLFKYIHTAIWAPHLPFITEVLCLFSNVHYKL